MLQLKVDMTDAMPPTGDQIFISMRIGEQQKLSKLSQSRKYRFPASKDFHYGRIEVFQRIGACNVDVDPANEFDRMLSVATPNVGSGNLGFKIAVSEENGHKKPTGAPVPQNKKFGAKANAAKEYLCKHDLEAHLAEAMQNLLHEKPENPTEYLATVLMGMSNRTHKLAPLENKPRVPDDTGDVIPSPPPTQKLAPLKSAPLARELPPPESQPKAKPIAQPNERIEEQQWTYHKRILTVTPGAWKKLYSKFPKPASVSKQQTAQWVERAMLEAQDVQRVFSQAAEDEKKAEVAARIVLEKKAFAKAKLTAMMESKKGPALAQFKDYFGTHFEAVSLLRLYQRFPAHEKAISIAAPPASRKVPFSMRPSVGTWLSHKLVVGAAQSPALPASSTNEEVSAAPGPKGTKFKLMPSVGTWLAPPSQMEPEQPAPKMMLTMTWQMRGSAHLSSGIGMGVMLL